MSPGPGSSPLTRGKHFFTAYVLPVIGLIPAHAGKTRGDGSRTRASRAHPRSRGENKATGVGVPSKSGSSPLTRGKPRGAGLGCPGSGLIPAHAGKTTAWSPASPTRRAHPRSRGENLVPMPVFVRWRGSSPLTRGKPRTRRRSASGAGLIPAHAGKTERRQYSHFSQGAHPRSRGENLK